MCEAWYFGKDYIQPIQSKNLEIVTGKEMDFKIDDFHPV